VGLIAPGTYIAPPGITGHRFGLFSVAAMPDDTGRWQLGVEYEPLAPFRADLRQSACVDDYTQDFDITPNTPTVTDGIPFVVVGSYNCKASSRPVEEAEERARLALIGGEERAVEYALMNGVMGNLPAFPGATVVAGGAAPVSLTKAFSELEQAMGLNYHSSGVIHLPRSLAAFTGRDSLMMREGQRLETMVGNLVAAGAGYDDFNESPTGVAAAEGERWIYATGAVTIRRGDVFLQPDPDHYLDKANNDLVIFAQRDYLVTFSGPVYAARVSLPVWEDCPCVELEIE